MQFRTGMLLFISHGAPSVAIEEDDFTRNVERFGARLSPRAIVLASAHWQTRGLFVNAVEHPEPIYDFGGFARELYAMRYDAPGSPDVAARVLSLLRTSGIDAQAETSRGWDHGVWVPMSRFIPDARIPIVELSLPYGASPEEMMSIGRALAPLRGENIIVAGSGGIVHNLSRINLTAKDAPPQSWAKEFDSWIASRLEAHDFEAIAHYRERAPHAALAVPTPEHFDPLFVVLGAASAEDELVWIHEGFHHGNLSMRSFALR